MKTKRIPILGTYTAMDLQRAMRDVLARAQRRSLNHQPLTITRALSAPIGCDVRADGTVIAL